RHSMILRHGLAFAHSEEPPLSEASYRAWGVAFALIGVLAFSFRPILIKLSYAAHPVTPTTLLFLRMMLALPFFAAIAWWLRGQQPRLGVLLVFASSLCYAVYLVADSQMVKRVGSMRFTAFTMVVATVPAAAQFLVLEPVFALELPAAVWWYAAIMATFSTVLPVFLQAEALKRIGANRFALIGAVGPVSVALTSALGLDEPFTWRQGAGGLLVIAGILLATRGSRS